MFQETNTEAGEHRPSQMIEVTVSCSFSRVDQPYHHQYGSDATVGTVLEAALRHFEVDSEPGNDFYLSHDRVRQATSTTLEDLAQHADELHFRLVKEIVQG